MKNSNHSQPPAGLRTLLRRVCETAHDEPSGDEADALMARLAEQRAAGRTSPELERDLRSHLTQFPERVEAFACLCELARLEAENALPPIDDLWDDLRRATRSGRFDAAQAARSPAAARSRPAAGRAADRRSGWWSIFGDPFPAPMAAVPVMLAALLVVTSVGWWRTARVAHDMETELTRVTGRSQSEVARGPGRGAAPVLVASGAGVSGEAIADTVGSATAVDFGRMPDGAWGRVAYDPTGLRAVVWMGGLSEEPGHEDEGYGCWFVTADGERVEAGQLRSQEGEGAGRPSMWYVEADRPIRAFDRLEMTTGSPDDILVIIPLEGAQR